MAAVEEQFRRMVFNLMARNQDDQVKTIAFLMDQAGQSSLAPAFDVTYSYSPAGSWTDRYQMTLNGKRDGFTLADFRVGARVAMMKRGRAETFIEEVRAAVEKWREFAATADVVKAWRKQIQQNLRLGLGSACTGFSRPAPDDDLLGLASGPTVLIERNGCRAFAHAC